MVRCTSVILFSLFISASFHLCLSASLLLLLAGCGSPQDTPSGEDETNTNTSEIITDGTRDNFWGGRHQIDNRDYSHLPQDVQDMYDYYQDKFDQAHPDPLNDPTVYHRVPEDDCPDPCKYENPDDF